jgi:Sap, sulfolipid-1-addressing protein
MLAQAAGLAFLAALSPTAILVSAVFLSSATPHRSALLYLAGALVMTAIVSVVVFVALQSGHLYKPHEHTPRYGLRLGLGVLMLLAGGYFLRRGPKPPKPDKQGKGLLNRLLARPRPWAAFLIGLFVYGPSLTFIAAVQVVATSKESVPDSVLGVAIVIVITVLLVWLPLTFFLVAPVQTTRLLHGLNGWLRSHGHLLLVGGLLIAGVVLTINGILGVAGVIGG